jgi:hypothetical protein
LFLKASNNLKSKEEPAYQKYRKQKTNMKVLTIISLCLAAAGASARTIYFDRRAASGNLQTFTGSLGGAATPVTNSGNADRPFEVNGDTFVNLSAALQRSCDEQFNACADQANSGSSTVSVAQCQTQESGFFPAAGLHAIAELTD